MGAPRALLLLFLLFFLLLVGRAGAAEPPPPANVLTLERSIELGLRNATLILKSESDIELAGAGLLQAYGQFLPNLTGGSSYGYRSGEVLQSLIAVTVTGANAHDGRVDLSSALNLFNGLSDQAGLKAALTSRDATRETLSWARQQVALDITQSYLQIVLDQQLLEIARKTLAASVSRLKLLQQQERVGSASIPDLYRQEAQASADQLAVLSYETRSHDDGVVLLRKIRLDERREYVFPAPPLASPTRGTFALAERPLAELSRQALVNRRDLASARLRLQAAEWGVSRAKGGYWPRLDLNFDRLAAGSYLLRQTVNGIDTLPPLQQDLIPQLGNQVTYTISLNLSWNIFDRFVTRLNTAQAERGRQYAEVDLDDTRLLVESDVRIGLKDYQVAFNQLDTARVGLAAAEKAYAAVEAQYLVGAASFTDLLTSQASLTQARASHVEAAINLTLRERALQYALGEFPLGP